MQHVDALNLNPPHLPVTIHGVHLTTIARQNWLLAAQQSDGEIIKIKEILESGNIQGNREIFSIFLFIPSIVTCARTKYFGEI